MDEHKQTYSDIILSPEKVVELTKEKLEQIEEERLKANVGHTRPVLIRRGKNRVNTKSVDRRISLSFLHSLIFDVCSLTHSTTYSIIHSLIHSFLHSFSHSFTHSFIYSFFHSFIQQSSFRRHGGWILDNFPQSKDVWMAFINDPLITPVEVVRLRESDPVVRIW